MKINAFWQRVRSLIREKQVTQAVVAKACGLSYSTFRKWITQNTIPPLDVATALSKYFGKSLEYLVHGKEENVAVKIGEVLHSLQKTNEKLKEVLAQAEYTHEP